ncbi:F-box/FBD/LRR-repeat protein At5g56420 [Medicago truncatula]|uniref:F-box/FBD/LRR-repeat protein At5g56420 n=1 Tax=Medicago truncatula TaxID=3880 RepID=UPI001967C9AF|nr:F-box/FBD/LRR-repeat protein At5g56420 [Medicago truncatula]
MSKPPETSTEEVDRISSLPDDILIQILSSLPTKQAFLTSILSKRWKHLWFFVPVIDFTKTKHSDSRLFDKFVDSILCLRKAAGNNSIHSFIWDDEHISHNWATITPKLSNTILTCTTLVVLKLSYLYMGPAFCYYPIILPSLKTLHLKDIKFDRYGDLKCLLGYCPVIEDLQLYHISYLTFLDPNRCCETLTKLIRADIIECNCDVPMKALSNVEFLRIKLYKTFNSPTFHNLTHLVLSYSWGIVQRVLYLCPKLQNIEFYQKIQGSIRDHEFVYGQNWVLPKFVPPCLSLSLKTCSMRDFGFAGLQHEHTMLATYILNNSSVLETMSIWCFRKRSEIERELTSCSRASATCKFSFYSEYV